MSNLNLILILMSIGGCWLAIATLPRWFLTGLNRSCLWQLRDSIVDDRAAGRLPRSAVVDALVAEIDVAIEIIPFLSPVTGWRLERAVAKRRPFDRAEEANEENLSAPETFTVEQTRLFDESTARLKYLLNRQIFTGSWAGLLRALFIVLAGFGPHVRVRLQPIGDVLPHKFAARPDRVVVPLWGCAVEIPRDSGAGQLVSQLSAHVAEVADRAGSKRDGPLNAVPGV
jgi:hypothetical protein